VSIEYLGNKTRLLDFIVEPIVQAGVQSVADLFCGTASVSQALSRRGIKVIANDHMSLCATLAEAALLAPARPAFRGLSCVVDMGDDGCSGYDAAVSMLNQIDPAPGYFHRTYSPASAKTGTKRMYLTEANAAKVDAIRARIEQWTPLMTRGERALLLRDLVAAVSRISNTAGTYGCYLKRWKQRALEPLELKSRHGARGARRTGHEVHCGEAATVLATTKVEALYLDPPYTKRQYAAYYHLLETLVRGDTPVVTGSTGLPRWQDRSSDFCYRRRAPQALSGLIAATKAPHVFLSYSDEGQIPHEHVLEILRTRGTVRWWEQSISRYRSNSRRQQASAVTERLYHLALG
jgi:adenine-specific DNA-methyltransferase